MAIEHIFILALIQGLTEFLPISSSGHLNLVHALTGFSDHGVAIDLALHSGTLLAVIIYFRRDIWTRLSAPFSLPSLCLVVASIPILLGGAAMVMSGLVDIVRMPYIIAWANLIFAIPLWLIDRHARAMRKIDDLTLRGALWIGLAQVFALIPGASRAGVTIMAGRALCLTRAEAARFSMLLAIPVIGVFTLANLWTLSRQATFVIPLDALFAMGLSAIIALLTIHIFLRLMRSVSLFPFVVYRVLLGVALLLFLS